MSETKEKQFDDFPIFWKVFGATILGFVGILLLSYINYISSNADRSVLDLRGDIKEIRILLDSQKEKLISYEQIKEKIVSVEKNIETNYSHLEPIKRKDAEIDVQISSLKEEIKSLKDANKELSKNIQETREKVISADVKKSEN